MISRFRTVLRGRRRGDGDAVHATLLKAINEAYDRIENHSQTYIEADDYDKLNIKCDNFEVSAEGTVETTFSPVFFEPIGVDHLPPPDVNHEETQKDLMDMKEYWGKPPPVPITLSDEVFELFYNIEGHFGYFCRDVPSGLSLEFHSAWLQCDAGIPELIADEFEGPVYQSHFCMPAAAWKDMSDPPVPHTMIALRRMGEADGRLLKSEALTISAAMITRLSSGEVSQHTIIPVMIVTIFGGWKLRLLIAHYSFEGLIIRKSGIIDFFSKEDGIPNMERLMSFMAARKVGNTKDLMDLFEVRF